MSKKPIKPKAPKTPKALKGKSPTATSPKTTKSTVVLFGLDETDKPRGARFEGQDEALLSRMAKGMGLRIGTPHAPHQFAVTSKLPKGDVHATGLKAVPQIALDLYEKLNALVGGETGAISTTQPKTWADAEPGQLVIAQDSLADGWWPAVIIRREEDAIVIKWRDFPGQGEFIRDVNAVALLKND
jgi:hypothetical protein